MDSKINLRFLENADYNSFMRALRAPWEDKFTFAGYWTSIAQENFSHYINLTREFSKGNLLPIGHVSCSLLFAFDINNEIVGRSSIRHQLSPVLLKVGGHIGYGVVPKFRRLGFATEILKESLIFARNELKDVTKVLVTCDDDNLGSIRTIEKNGGILENILILPEQNTGKRRYWINL